MRTYRASIWDHEAESWETRFEGISKWGLRAVIRALLGQGWDTVTYLIEREEVRPVTAPELARLVREMRRCQTVWFKYGRAKDLHYSRDLERRVDAAVSTLLDPQQPSLPLGQPEKSSDRD